MRELYIKVYLSESTVTFFALALLKHIVALRSFLVMCSGLWRHLTKMNSKDLTVLEEARGDLARALPDGHSHRHTYNSIR